MELLLKQKQFNSAMELFNTKPIYKLSARFVSIINVSLQLYLICVIREYSIGPVLQLVALPTAYVMTDFLNGLVHMYMDNNDNYESLAGPLVANFHMHHKIPRYRKHNLLVVYFNETGAKIWLIGYLLAVVMLLQFHAFTPAVLYILVYIGILSSVAEVSHYLCHTSSSPLTLFLENCGLFLSKHHHASHHINDNNSYAFLNGITDPLLNLIAVKLSKGYKYHTDLHYSCYEVPDMENR